MSEDIYTPPIASKELGVSRQTIYQWMDDGILEYTELVGKRVFTKDQLNQALRIAKKRPYNKLIDVSFV